MKSVVTHKCLSQTHHINGRFTVLLVILAIVARLEQHVGLVVSAAATQTGKFSFLHFFLQFLPKTCTFRLIGGSKLSYRCESEWWVCVCVL